MTDLGRALGYEFFKAMHLFAVVVFVVVLFWHCDWTLTSWDYFIATAAIYVPCYVYPWIRTIFEYGGRQQARLFIEDNGFIRITIPAKFDWKPGHHCFLRFTSFGILNSISAHPFTICSLPSTNPNEESELVFYIRHQKGFTAKLYELALEQPGVPVPVMVDGPYGGINQQRYYEGDHLLVIAGGSGAGWILPFIEQFVRTSSSSDEEKGQAISTDEKESLPITHNASAVPQSLRVILATRDIGSRTWFLQTVTDLLSKYPTSDSSSIKIQVYLTGDAASQVSPTPNRTSSIDSTDKIAIPSSAIQSHEIFVPGKEFEGRPELENIVREEAARAEEEGGDLSVFCCGPTTMLNDVRNAVAGENLEIVKGRGDGGRGGGGVYLHSEHFSWA